MKRGKYEKITIPVSRMQMLYKLSSWLINYSFEEIFDNFLIVRRKAELSGIGITIRL